MRKNERKVKGVEATGAVWVPERLEAATRTPGKGKEVIGERGREVLESPPVGGEVRIRPTGVASADRRWT